MHSTGVQVPLVLKNLECLPDVLGLQQLAPTGGDQQGSRSQRVQAALYGDPPSATFVDEKDCRFWRFSRDQNRLRLAGRDITRFLELDSRRDRDAARASRRFARLADAMSRTNAADSNGTSVSESVSPIPPLYAS